MTFEEYEQGGRALYAAFADAVASILDASLKANSAIRVQVIQRRAKAPSEVRKKLSNAEVGIETQVKDLAGVRIIVYSNSDIDRLDAARILWGNFDIVWEKTKFHYPRAANDAEQSQFIGRNYVVRLKDDRAALPEYMRFAGLLCEVQVQTILDHAWSETAHDTIYKSPKLNGVGAAQMTKIKERMRDIQQKYLLRAGYEFQQVLNDFEHIVSGQLLVESDILISIRDATDNNVRVELLKKYATTVLPIIDDKAAAAPELRSVLIETARRAVSTGVTPIETPIGSMAGRTYDDVVEQIIGILADLQYIEPAEAFATYADLFVLTETAEPTQRIVKAVGELSRHAIPVWQRFGPAVQEILLDAIAATRPERLAASRPLMIEVADQCLRSEVTGTSATSTSFIWQTGAVELSDRMHVVRERAMAMLQDLFSTSQDVEERRRLYSALQSATRLPSQGRYGDPLQQRVLNDTAAVITFMTGQTEDLDLLFKESIEEDTMFDYRRAKYMPTGSLHDEGVRSARDAVVDAALALRARFNADPEYVIFKTLVGFRTVFDYEWDEDEDKDEDDDAVDVSAKDAFRKARVAEYVAQVTEETADAWFDRLNGYAAVKSDDQATFPVLGGFISDVAQTAPKVGATWLERSRDQPLAQFRPGMLRGLYASDRDAAMKWIDQAIDRKDDLTGIAHFIRHAEPALPDFLERVASAGIQERSDGAVLRVLEACAARPSEFGDDLARRLAIEALTYLSGHGLHQWTEPLWVWGTRSGLLAGLDDQSRAALFDAICRLPKIDYRAESILTILAETHAAEIIDLFGSRLERERAANSRDLTDRYEAIPFDFSELHKTMQKSGSLLLPKALEWHRADPILGRFRSARVVANIFPEVSDEVLALLTAYARSGENDAQKFVIDVMSNYDGADIAFTVLKELVAVLPVGDELLGGVRTALGETGVMHGEFGYRDALIAERERLLPWLTDEREPVRLFAESEVRSLDNAIAAAQQDAEADIAQRRLRYGEGLDDPGPEGS